MSALNNDGNDFLKTTLKELLQDEEGKLAYSYLKEQKEPKLLLSIVEERRATIIEMLNGMGEPQPEPTLIEKFKINLMRLWFSLH